MGPILLAMMVAPASAGTWQPNEVLQPLFAVASPPEQPVVAVSSGGHALAAWDDTGDIKYAERTAGGTWTLGAKVRNGATGGPVQAAIGSDDTAAVAWVTVGTEFVPAYLVASVHAPSATFPAPSSIALGTGVWYFDLGIAGDGTTVITWQDAAGVEVSSLAPGSTVWTSPVLVSDPLVPGAYPDLAIDDLGDVVVVWVQGAAPSEIGSAYLLAGSLTWETPSIVSSGSGLDVWGPRVGIDAAGNAAVGYADGSTMAVATRTATGAWDPPVTVSDPAQSVYFPSFAMDDAGDLLAAWQTLDPSTGLTAIWASAQSPGAPWTAPVQLSRNADTPDWPTAALSNDGSVAAVSWVDDTSVVARVSIGIPGPSGYTWTRKQIGGASWGSTVPVAAGRGVVAASWALQLKSNPNAARIVGKAWE